MKQDTRWVRLSSIIVALFIVLPLLWMLITSFKSPSQVGITPPPWLPHPFTWVNYRMSFTYFGFQRYFLNSVIVAVSSTLAVLLLGTGAGYALARTPVRGRMALMVGLLVISVFPEIAVISPLYLLMRLLGWLDTYQGLIVPYTAFNLPFSIWILRNYFLSIPREMEEVAQIDGASPFRTVVSVILPQSTPGLFTAAVFTFTATWTEFLMALTIDSSTPFRTIPVGIALFGAEFTVPYGNIFAASVISIVPIALMVLIFRNAIVSGLTQGAVRG